MSVADRDDRNVGQSWEKPRLTSTALFVLGAMNLVDCINCVLLTPYVDRMVSEFLGRPTDDGSVVQTVGLLIGIYSLCEVIFSPFWGYLADRFGRRPVMLIGLAGSAVAPVMFGLATNLSVAFIARGIDGFFCGNVGVTKTYLGELVDGTNEARGFSFLAICFSMGLILGPMLGGQLVDPAVWLPGIFEGTIFDWHPYLLPNLTYACFAAVAWMLGFCFLRETLPPRERMRNTREAAASTSLIQNGVEGSQLSSSVSFQSDGDKADQQKIATRIAIFFMFSYSLLTGYYAAWSQNFVLIVSLPRNISGFALSPREIGALQNASGVGLMLTQLLFYPYFTRRLGFLSCFVGGCVVNLIVTLLFPAYGLMADPDTFGAWRYAPLAIMMFLGQAAAGFCFPTIFVWINRSLNEKDKGTWNGCINSIGALFRAIFPPAMDTMLSFGLHLSVPGGRYLPIFVNSLACLVLVILVKIGVRAQETYRTARKVAISLQGNFEGDVADTLGGA